MKNSLAKALIIRYAIRRPVCIHMGGIELLISSFCSRDIDFKIEINAVISKYKPHCD